MNMKMMKVLILTLVLLTVFASTAFADEVLVEDIGPQPFYYSFTGTVKEVTVQDNGSIRAFIVDEEGLEANFILSEETYYLDNVEVKEGNEITGYYESGKPMILIYPPQYSIDIVTPVYEEGSIKIDKFDSNLLSKDEMLKLNISEDTEILWENGTAMNWLTKPEAEELKLALTNRVLIVFYDFTTKSIPPQTSPNKILVLSEQKVEPIQIFVNGKLIEEPEAFIDGDTVMIPVRAVAELLGFEVTWNNEERSVSIGNDISFKIGENSFVFSQAAKELEASPIINNAYTYVPLSFFKEISNVNEQKTFEHFIEISNE